MKLICPSCGAVASAEAWVTNADARQCMRILAELPTDVARKVLPYLAMFRPRVPENEKGYRGLVWPRALRLLAELQRLVAESHISWDNRPARPNSVAAWSQAIEQVVQRPPRRLPLATHGYLRRIAYDVADQIDRAVETKHNQTERDGTLRRKLAGGRMAGGLGSPLSKEQMRAIRNKNMGR